MNRKLSCLCTALVVGALIVVLMVLGGCETRTPLATKTLSTPTSLPTLIATPVPTLTPFPTTISISREVIPFLYQQEFMRSYPKVVARTENGIIMQVWDYEQQLIAVPPENDTEGVWTKAQPNMLPCRACSGDESVQMTVQFEIRSFAQVTAELCVSNTSGNACRIVEMIKENSQWKIASNKLGMLEICDCHEENR